MSSFTTGVPATRVHVSSRGAENRLLLSRSGSPRSSAEFSFVSQVFPDFVASITESCLQQGSREMSGFLPQYHGHGRHFRPVATNPDKKGMGFGEEESELQLLNPNYENMPPINGLRDLARDKHEYEDPSQLGDQVRVLQHKQRQPRRKHNQLYEPHKEHFKVRSTDSESSDCSVRFAGQPQSSCLSRCMHALVFLISTTSLVMVILMMFGKLGPQANCGCKSGEWVSSVNFRRNVKASLSNIGFNLLTLC